MAEPLLPPSGDELQLLRWLDALDSEGEATRREVSRSWDENIRQVRGDQWRIKRPPYFLANMIKNQMKRKIASLTESKPEFKVSSRKPGLENVSRILYYSAKAIFDQSHTQDAMYRACQFAFTMGAGFFETVYEPEIDDIVVRYVDPRRVYIDPGITQSGDLERAQYTRLDSITPLADLRRRFPGRGSLVQADERYSSHSEGSKGRTSLLSAALTMMPRPFKSGHATKSGPIPRCEVREYWIRDPQINLEGNLLFPGGRHVIRAGNIILRDEPNPYWDGKPTLDMFEWDTDFESPWGMDEVQDLRRLQESINRMGDAWVRNILLGSNFRIVADVDALDPEQWDKLDNEAGLIIRKKPTRQFEYQPPIPDSGAIPNALPVIMQIMDQLTGNLDNSQSQATASSAFEGLQLARQLLVRSVARRLETCVERIGQKLIARIFQFYTADRVLSFQGPDKEWMSYVFERQKLLEDDQGNKISPDERIQMFRDFKFLVTPESSLAMTRVQRTMAMLQLRSATGFAPPVRRILAESDMGDADQLMKEGIEELKWLPAPPAAKGRGGKK